MVIVPMICFTLKPFLKVITESMPKHFLQIYFFSLGFLSDLVMLFHMLLTMVYIVYQYPFVGRAVVRQLFEFAVWQHLFGNLYQQIVHQVFKNSYEFGFEF